jgi:hypothetical protein
MTAARAIPRARTAAAAAALAFALVATPSPANAQGSLTDEYLFLGRRLGDQPALPQAQPPPLAFPAGGPAAAYPLRGPTEVRVARGGALIVAEEMTGRVLRVGASGRVSVLAGRRADTFALCGGARAGGIVASRYENKVLDVRGSGTATTLAGTGRTGFAGDGGPATQARLNGPTCATRAADGAILVADPGNHRVRRIAPDGTISTIAGNGEARFAGEGGPATATGMTPQAIVALPDGGALVTDPADARVLRIHPDGTLTTFAGTGAVGFDGDGGPARAARLTAPWGIARAVDGSVAVTDFGSQTVRTIAPDGTITTVLGAPPQRAASPSRARSAWVPPRRRVSSWIEPRPGSTSSGERAVSDEAAAGRVAVIRLIGYGGNTVGVTVVRGRATFDYNPEPVECWAPRRTGTGPAGDPLQGRDVQAGAGAPVPYQPGPGAYAPDLARGRLVLARAPIVLDDTPQFGVPAWATTWSAQRLADYLIDRRTGRVVAVQLWSPSGFERQYRIRALPRSLPIDMPSTRPRLHYGEWTPESVSFWCGSRRASRNVFGYASGIALARRVSRRMGAVPAIRVRAAGRASVGRRFTAVSAFRLERGRIRAGITRVSAPGRPQANVEPPGGSYTAVTWPSGDVRYLFRGSSCWTGGGPVGEGPGPSYGDLTPVMPLWDAFFERPRRRGGLITLRAYTAMSTVDSLIDPRDMRLVAQRWNSGGDRGLLRVGVAQRSPDLPDPVPLCPASAPG